MINLNDPLIKRLIDNLHKSIERKSKNFSETSYDNYILENRIIKFFCEDKTTGPRQCAAALNARYKTNMDNEDVIRILKANLLSYQAKRAELLNWADNMIAAFAKALETQKQKDFDEFISFRNRVIRTNNGEHYKIQERIASIMFYVKLPELDSGNDANTLEKFGNVYMKHFIYDISDFLRNICLRPKNNAKGDKKDSQADSQADSQTEKIELLEKIEHLENMLNRSDMLLKDLQDEFDARIRQSHQDDLVEFFSRLNSERYGCILDEVLNARNGIRQLRKEKVQLPPEIGGLFILIERLTQFIRDSEINPILKPGVVKNMGLEEIESCDYAGSPFLNSKEIKKVKVLSPGWVYKDKDVQISRPRLKEVTE